MPLHLFHKTALLCTYTFAHGKLSDKCSWLCEITLIIAFP